MELTIVDVFAERPLAGNQLAVVREVGGLSDEAMQAIEELRPDAVIDVFSDLPACLQGL